MLAIQAQSDVDSPKKKTLDSHLSPRSIDVNQIQKYSGIDTKHASGGPFTSKPPMSDHYVKEKVDQLHAGQQNPDIYSHE